MSDSFALKHALNTDDDDFEEMLKRLDIKYGG